MACGAIRQVGSFDKVLCDQFARLFGVLRRLRPIHVEHLILWPNVAFGMTVTGQAPSHRERLFLAHERHPLHRAVADSAADAFRDMNAMIKEYIIGKTIDALPMQWLARGIAPANGRQHLRICPYLRVTCHADVSGGQPGKRGLFHAGMTHATIKPQIADVMSVTERNRLRPRDVLIGGVRRVPDKVGERYRAGGYSKDRHNNDDGDAVRARPE